ncbi:head processing protein [Photobacterium toruni]|uniref:Head processing protein n=1 Tax=Photobacterium toruni TaxID=1935446 RepID=A0ABU6L9Q1_9GAMM|nr:head processing protein [Photobacterium toruni]
MSKKGVLRTVTDRFCLFNDGRNLGGNKRNYITSSVKSMFESAQTKELLRLKEAIGFYGHKARERANKLFVGESEIIYIDGKPVAVENIPANRTIDISIDEETGIVTHTQEILDTPAGAIVNALIESRQGGWSWATSGRDGQTASYANTFAGVDYVLQPNYLSLDHPSMMMESVTDRDTVMLEAMNRIGVDESSTQKVMAIGDSSGFLIEQVTNLEQQNMYLESLVSVREGNVAVAERKLAMLIDSVEQSLPIFLSDEQKSAIHSLKSENDINVVQSMFESIGRINFGNLPINSHKGQTTATVQAPKVDNMVQFGSHKVFK